MTTNSTHGGRAHTVAFSQLSQATIQSSPDIQAKLTRAVECSAAALKASSELISAVGFTGTVGSPVDEWKERRATIDHCDKILVDLRKTGFGFVTAVVGVVRRVAQKGQSTQLRFGQGLRRLDRPYCRF